MIAGLSEINMKKYTAVFWTAVLVLLIRTAGTGCAEAISEMHRVKNTYTDTKNGNKSIVRLWQVETANENVTEEINGIAKAWAEEKGNDLPAAQNSTKKNSRLDVEIRYSRTGHSWLSFLVQSRTTYHRKLTEQVFTTRTYDMNTGERIRLRDIFDDDDQTWVTLGEEIREGLTCVFTEKEVEQTITADQILICIGRRPNTEGLFAGEPMVQMERGFILVNEFGQTSIPHIYAIGDVTGGLMLAHEATAEGRNAVAHMAGKTPEIRKDIIPGCIYTEPEIASVGLTVDQAKEQGIAADSRKYPMTANGKTVVAGAERGFIKVVFDPETRKILGAQMMCERATDMISEFATAIVNDLTLEDLGKVVRPHPTFSEAITEAVR